jgi:predicted transcriptional regulator
MLIVRSAAYSGRLLLDDSLVARDVTKKNIADELEVSEGAVSTHLRRTRASQADRLRENRLRHSGASARQEDFLFESAVTD